MGRPLFQQHVIERRTRLADGDQPPKQRPGRLLQPHLIVAKRAKKENRRPRIVADQSLQRQPREAASEIPGSRKDKKIEPEQRGIKTYYA